MRSLRDDGRNEGENSRNFALGFMGDDDYDGALSVDGGKIHSKKWVINSSCSFHICCEKEKFSKLKIFDGGLVTLPKDEMEKVEGIGEAITKSQGIVKRKVADVRYFPKFEKNLISLGQLQVKRCTFKVVGGLCRSSEEAWCS